MTSFIRFLWDNPFFTACFLFYNIPFWVPLVAISSGADPILMILLAVTSILAKSYIESELLLSNPYLLMFKYFIALPFKSVFKFLLLILLVAVIIFYAMQGEPLDKGISAVLLVFIVKVLYFRPPEAKYWNVKGLEVYRLYAFAGKTLAAILWLVFLFLGLGFIDNVAVGILAIIVSSFTFYKTSEGLI